MTTPIRRCLDRRSPPLPWLDAYAAHIAGEQPEALRTDAGAITRSVETCIDLFGLPAVAISLDPMLAAEAAGCSMRRNSDTPTVASGCIASFDDALAVDPEDVVAHDRLATVLEATDRLATTASGCSVLGGMTGPATLVDALLVDADPGPALREETWFVASDIQVALANAYLERGADGVVILEPAGTRTGPGYEDAIVPLINVVDHFDAATVLVVDSVTESDLERSSAFGIDAVTGHAEDVDRLARVATDHDVTLGVAVPNDHLVNETIGTYLSSVPDDVLVTTERDVPAAVPPESLHALMNAG